MSNNNVGAAVALTRAQILQYIIYQLFILYCDHNKTFMSCNLSWQCLHCQNARSQENLCFYPVQKYTSLWTYYQALNSSLLCCAFLSEHTTRISKQQLVDQRP